MTPEEKAARIAKIEARLAELNKPQEEPVGILDRAGQALNFVGGLGRGAAAGALEPLIGKDIVSAEEVVAGKVPSTAELMSRAGVPEGYSIADALPIIEKGGMLDVSLRGAGGLVGDILLDPTTYLLPEVKGLQLLAKAPAAKALAKAPMLRTLLESGLGKKAAESVNLQQILQAPAAQKAMRATQIGLNPIGEAFSGLMKGTSTVGTALAGKASQFTPEEASQYLRNKATVDKAVSMLSDKRNLDEAQQLAFEAVNKMRETVKKAGLDADQELSQILEGKNVEINLSAIKERLNDLPEKQRLAAQKIVDRAEKDLVAYRPFAEELLPTTMVQPGVKGLTYPEVRTPAEIVPSTVEQQVAEQAEMFPLETVTRTAPGISPASVQQLGAGAAGKIPATMIPSDVEQELIQKAFFPPEVATKVEANMLPSRLERPAYSEVFSPEFIKSAEFSGQEPLPFMPRGVRPEAATIPAPEARLLKQIFQEEAKYAKASPVSAKGAPREEDFAAIADAINANLRKIDNVKALDDFMRQGIVMQEALQQGERAPLQFLKTQSEDTAAMLARSAKRAKDTEVFDLANQLSAARKILGKGDYDDWVSRSGIRFGGRQSLRVIDKFNKTGQVTQKGLEKVMKDPNIPSQIWLEMLSVKPEGEEK